MAIRLLEPESHLQSVVTLRHVNGVSVRSVLLRFTSTTESSDTFVFTLNSLFSNTAYLNTKIRKFSLFFIKVYLSTRQMAENKTKQKRKKQQTNKKRKERKQQNKKQKKNTTEPKIRKKATKQTKTNSSTSNNKQQRKLEVLPN